MTDAELFLRWRDGDSEAGDELFGRHFKALFRFFRGKVRTGADDLVQETFLACVRGRDGIRSGSSFRAYMFVVARRLLGQQYARKDDRVAPDFNEMSLAALSPGPSAIVAKQQEDRLILEGLRQLPLDYQICLELHEWEGLSGRELAEVLDVPEGTIRSRLRRGRIRLGEAVEQLAKSPALLRSTKTRLEDWASAIRELVDDPAS